jgi:tetratricopeptide (TPR) repeat protein
MSSYGKNKMPARKVFCSDAGSVSSTTGPPKPISRCWMRSGVYATNPEAGGCWNSWISMHRPGWSNFRHFSVLLILRNCRAKRWGGVTHPRMLRELTDAIEAISIEKPLVLWFEDMHWCDYSTLEWLGFVARRQEAAPLLVLGTYRPVEVIVREHPLKNLKHELQIHGQCQELPLTLLGEAAVREYLNLRFTHQVGCHSSNAPERAEALAQEGLQELAHTIYQRTEGNPLFMVNLVDYLAEKTLQKTLGSSAIVQPTGANGTDRIDTPPSTVEMIERNLERLHPDEQALLEAASVAGAEFAAAAVAAALAQPVSDIESCCVRLSRRQQFVQSLGTEEWPDGTVAATFQFLHSLYRDVLYDRVPPGRRLELHRQIAECKETAWGQGAAEIATELAHHYRRAGNIGRTISYLERAAEQAVRRSAFTEGLENYYRALELLDRLPQSSERDLRELRLSVAAMWLLWGTTGPSSHETIQALQRSTSLAEKSGNLASLVLLLTQAGMSALISADDMRMILTLADRALELALREGGLGSLLFAHSLQIQARFVCGDLRGVEKHFVAEMELVNDPTVRRKWSMILVQDFGVAGLSAWILARPDLARQRIAEMIAITNAKYPYELAFSRLLTAEFRFLLREYDQSAALAGQALELSEKHQFPLLVAMSRCARGRVQNELGHATLGIELLRQGITSLFEIGARLNGFGNKISLALSQEAAGTTVKAMETIDEALQQGPKEYYLRPIMLTVRGGLKLKQGRSESAEADFREALTLSRSMGAKMYELDAIKGLARLLASRGRRDEAHAMLAEIYNWFTEGFDTADLKEAKALLDELSR